MKIIIVTTFFSKEMGYAENGISKALASLGHEVHLITSNLNVYGDSPNYDDNYLSFLGPADQGVGSFDYYGCKVHRLPSRSIAGYVLITGLVNKIREINPEIVHCITMASLSTYVLALLKPFFNFSLFSESHQHASVVREELKSSKFHPIIRTVYFLTRTLPTYLASFSIEKCYAISPDCLHVAEKFYGIPKNKLELINIVCDTNLFHPVNDKLMENNRKIKRNSFGYDDDDIVCIYTGRLSDEKNPLLLAQAINSLSEVSKKWRVIFIGNGSQYEQILLNKGVTVIPFMLYTQLPGIYRMADIGVWPTQESLSMLDASAAGLPLVLSDQIGDKGRIAGNGYFYVENNLNSMIEKLSKLQDLNERREMSLAGFKNIEENYSWNSIVKKYIYSYKKIRRNYE